MARGTLSENERCCLDSGEKTQPDGLLIKNDEVKPNGLRVRFLDEEGKTERLVSTDEVDCVAHVKKIHFLKSRSSSETSLLLRNNSLLTRRGSLDTNTFTNNNCLSENLNRASILKHTEVENNTEKTEQTKDSNNHYKKHTNVYSVNQAKTLTTERRKSLPTIPRLMSNKDLYGSKSSLPAEVCMADAAFGKDFTARTLGRLSRGLSRLLRRTNSVSISEPDPVYKVAYLGNVLTGWARGETCIEKPLATLWRNYQQFNKPDVVMKLSVTNSGLKGFTKEHGLTEYWSHRITYCASPPHYPKLFCWVYRHEGKKLKHELRCHAVLCTKETVSKKITEELQVKLKQALAEFKKTMLSKQNARLSLANSVYENPSMPRRKILLSVGATNYRPPLERSKSAPKLGAIEEMCSEEDEEEAEMNANNETSDSAEDEFCTQTLDRRRRAMNSPRKMSCPSTINRVGTKSNEGVSDDIIKHLIDESNANNEGEESSHETSQDDERFHRLESIEESSETNENADKILLSQSNFLVTDSDDGSVSSGCETASTVNSDTEPSSLPSNYPQDEPRSAHACDSDKGNEGEADTERIDEVNHVPIGEKNFKRRCTYPPLKTEVTILADFEIDNLDFDSLNSCNDGEVFKNSGDNESACSDESGYSELLDGKESVIGSTIMV